MAITSLNTYINAAKQQVNWGKVTMTTVANIPFSPFAQGGDPGAGVLAGTSVAAGVVPTDATAGCPSIGAFGGSATGYLSRVEFASSVACRITIYDLLWKGGAYAFNANQALTGQPSFAGRLPGGSYKGLELHYEQVTQATGIQSVNVTYDDDADVSKTTGVTSQGTAGIVGRMFRFPLAAGGVSVKKVTNVTGSVATVGTFNILIMRRLWSGRVPVASFGDIHPMTKTGLPIIFADSALIGVVTADSTALGVPEVKLEIANG